MKRIIYVGLFSSIIGSACLNTARRCTKDSDCLGTDFCDLSVNTCAFNPNSGPDAGPGWTLALTAPANGARINGTATASATLTFVGGGTPTPPSSLTLSATPTTGTALTSTLPKSGTNTYAGTLPSGLTSDTAYTLQAQYPGGSLDGGLLLSNTALVTFDNVAPVFSIAVLPPSSSRINNASLVLADPSSNVVGASAYRRDEIATVQVISSATDVDGGSVQLTVTGIGAGATPTVVALTPCAGSGYCGQALVDMSKPTMSAFNGYFELNASGTDTAGNSGTAAGDAGVTRWKWSFAAGGGATIKASPAIGHQGTIYFGTGSGTSVDRFYALNADGTVKWQNAVGSVTASPAVGAWDAGYEVVYVGAQSSGGAGVLSAFNSVDGSAYGTPYSAGTDLQASLTVVPTIVTADSALPMESAVTVLNLSGTGGRLLALRPTAATYFVLKDTGVSGVNFPGNVVTDGTNFYFGDANTTPSVEGFSFGGAGVWTTLGSPLSIGSPINSLALSASGVFGVAGFGGPNGGIFSLATLAGPATKFPTSLNGSPAYGVVLTGSDALYGDDSGKLKRIPLNLSALNAQPAANGNIHAAPVVGSDARVYTADTGFALQAWSGSLVSEWVATIATRKFEASPNIDCARDNSGGKLAGRPGVLYAGNDDGHLYAVIVDSQGIDTTPGDWPKYQHDPRNTGNTSTPLTEFQCQ